MLILTRRLKEVLVFGDNDIRVEVLGVKGNQVRVGIEAQPSIAVNREEIYNVMVNQGQKIPSLSVSGPYCTYCGSNITSRDHNNWCPTIGSNTASRPGT